ncbi:MAG: AIPR family protein [Leptonema illini]|uniref:AIPR family protein n=1 Tax=Leptonema illini TaxID=183 RepID=A0A833LWA5_9LEPT|nr:MAG: AIPR family protein [Leptonema illini]
MTAISREHLTILEKVLEDGYVQHLPPLLDNSKPPDEQKKKNQSRAFGAFALQCICDISKENAAISVVDDFDDLGLDVIYYHESAQVLYFVQAKLKIREEFRENEALAFCRGIRKLIGEDFAGFNEHVQKRRAEIEDALENCSEIKLVIAHIGPGVSSHATQAINDFICKEEHGEMRLARNFVNFDGARVVTEMQLLRANPQVDVKLSLEGLSKVNAPRETYWGLVELKALAELHTKYHAALYEKNIRTFLGLRSEVNASIQETLASSPEEFFYRNNGITALCKQILPKGQKDGRRILDLRGLSIINGAQTIASTAAFLESENPHDISEAKVLLTLIVDSGEGGFGKSVTRSRNHQNTVSFSNFAALDAQQERLRRELSLLGVYYMYKHGKVGMEQGSDRISIEEASHALAMRQSDPRYVVWVKKEPSQLLNIESDYYRSLFSTDLTAFQLINSVRLYRYVCNRLNAEENRAVGQERLIYKHGKYALAWILAKRLNTAIDLPRLLETAGLEEALSVPFDELRQRLSDSVRVTLQLSEKKDYLKGPRAFFCSQTDVIPLLQNVMLSYFGLIDDDVAKMHLVQSLTIDQYSAKLFSYLISRAPQIGITA